MNTGKLKFVADVNIEKAIVDLLREKGFDIKWVTEFNPAMNDPALLRMATAQKRILLTNDKDFGEMVFLQKKLSHGTILLRVKGQQSNLKVRLVGRLIERHGDKLAGHFVVVTKDKFRFIPLEVKA